MKTGQGVLALSCLLFLQSCGSLDSRSVTGGLDDEALVEEIDAVIEDIVAGAARVDADAVLASSAGEDSLTLVVGDVLLSGHDEILERFRESYEPLQSQEHTLVEKRIRILGPDIALALLTAWGTYTDDAGWTSDPVGLGLTLVLVRRDGRWRLTHAHQSFIE